MNERSRFLMSTHDLSKILEEDQTVILDGTYHLATANRNADTEFLMAHIPGAQRFDIDTIKDKNSSLPHMLPSPMQFSEAVGRMGISHTSRIVIYDADTLFGAARVWWMFRIMGAERVFILDGGLKLWQQENHPVASGPAKPRRPEIFSASFQKDTVADTEHIQCAIRTGDAMVLDARPAERFSGDAPEPRPGIRRGHIPGSRNLPYTDLLEDGRLKSLQDIRAIFEKYKIDPAKPIITTCGSGITAALLWLALESINNTPHALYDGSWAEWGSREDLPIE